MVGANKSWIWSGKPCLDCNTLQLAGKDVEKFDINSLFVEIDWMLEESPHDAYDYIYDQVVSIGELVSSRILYHAMVAALIVIKAAWPDIEGVLYR